MHEANKHAETNRTSAETDDAEKSAVQTKVIKLIRCWAHQPKERWIDLRSRARSKAASELVAHIRTELERLEDATNLRRRKRREKGSSKFSEAIERLVGDLLRARAGRKSDAGGQAAQNDYQLRARCGNRH
jgi:hypothetical protein